MEDWGAKVARRAGVGPGAGWSLWPGSCPWPLTGPVGPDRPHPHPVQSTRLGFLCGGTFPRWQEQVLQGSPGLALFITGERPLAVRGQARSEGREAGSIFWRLELHGHRGMVCRKRLLCVTVLGEEGLLHDFS